MDIGWHTHILSLSPQACGHLIQPHNVLNGLQKAKSVAQYMAGLLCVCVCVYVCVCVVCVCVCVVCVCVCVYMCSLWWPL